MLQLIMQDFFNQKETALKTFLKRYKAFSNKTKAILIVSIINSFIILTGLILILIIDSKLIYILLIAAFPIFLVFYFFIQSNKEINSRKVFNDLRKNDIEFLRSILKDNKIYSNDQVSYLICTIDIERERYRQLVNPKSTALLDSIIGILFTSIIGALAVKVSDLNQGYLPIIIITVSSILFILLLTRSIIRNSFDNDKLILRYNELERVLRDIILIDFLKSH